MPKTLTKDDNDTIMPMIRSERRQSKHKIVEK